MRHFTCDKCGYPMEQENSFNIQHTTYEICVPCQSEILKGLDGKGKNDQLKDIQDFIDKKKKDDFNYPKFGQGLVG